MDNRISQLIQTHGLERVAHKIEESLQPAIRISTTGGSDHPVGASRFGGLPDVPPAFTWPRWKEFPLGFIAQLRCGELAALDPYHVLPATGMLYFFYDFQEQPWGFDPQDRGAGVILHVDDVRSLSPAAVPDGAQAGEISISPSLIQFSSLPTIPAMRSATGRQLGLETEERRRYFDFHDAVRQSLIGASPNHQMLGHSDNVQGDMPLECQLVSHGLYCGNSSGYEDPRRASLEPGAAEWRLLLQMDTDDTLNVMWGDCGMIYFWIRESDLRARQFDQCWTILQCG